MGRVLSIMYTYVCGRQLLEGEMFESDRVDDVEVVSHTASSANQYITQPSIPIAMAPC